MNQLKAGALLSYVNIGLIIIIGLLYTPFMLRTMGQDQFGLYSLASSVIAYLTVLDLGFGNAIIRYTAKYKAEGNIQKQYEVFGMFHKIYSGIGIAVLLIGIIITFFSSDLFSKSMNTDELHTLKILLIIMSLNLAVTLPLSIYGSIITAYEKFIFLRVTAILRTFLNPAIMILFLMFGYKAIAMALVTTVFNIATLFINKWYCHKKLNIKITSRKIDKSLFKEIALYSIWIFFNIIMDRIYWSTGQFILGVYKGASIVAIYAVAIQLQNMFFMFSTAISGVFLPKVTAMISTNVSDAELSGLFIKTGRIQFIIVSYILSGFIVFGKPFIILWAGSNYAESYLITLILFIPVSIPLIQNLGIIILQAKNQLKFRSITYLIIALASMLMCIPLSKHYGGIGCAIATSGALILGQVIIMNIYYHTKIKLNIIQFWLEIGKMSLPVLAILGIGYMCHSSLNLKTIPELIAYIITYTLAFCLLIYIFSLNHYEKKLFITPLLALKKKLIK